MTFFAHRSVSDGRRAARVGVAPGRYCVSLTTGHCRYIHPEDESAHEALARFCSLLKIEMAHPAHLDFWPRALEVRDGTVALPPIRLRLLEEIVLRSPKPGASVDLREEFFRWDHLEVGRPVRYGLNFSTLHGRGSMGYGGPADLTDPRVCLGILEPLPRNQLSLLSEALVPGLRADWSVDAYDDDGNHIGRSVGAREFIVAHGFQSIGNDQD
ncbi:hypothetical protein [Tautonia plasticadhaerens]|uniref:Uncharacterized protein n=1 Tax=Tautonia plasticadhaerens TaxID=2527974 RepID=A0A518HF60_9BACT|nr:hypothetical protein [Tautonia plasticadhaerens]QDV39458.1 hypothetical protein ElP_74250 [Tautonia plasticadhaerens]